MSEEQRAESPASPAPWEAVAGTIMDARGFAIADMNSLAILPGYAEKLGIKHWGERPGVAYLELTDAETDANAVLMAAAPALLAAARGALEYLTDFLSPCDDDCECVIHPLRAAVAAATGGAS